ncbi:MAG: ABC transporter substrate-binding protein [Candidatus Bathyarchaeota archaeon]|nr:MAG: ABC transporter substrate-binding protein [Candidatus Bathyarchaeota archaeon]
MDKNITYIIAIVAVISLIVSAFGYITFEGQISDIKTSISDLELAVTNNDISSVEDDVSSIQSQLADIQQTIDTYQSAITDLETQVGEQQDKIDEYQQTIEDQQAQLDEYKQVTLVDGLGNVVTLTELPERIVSLSPSNTEILFAVGAGDKVVGVTDFCNYPYDFSSWVEAGNMTSIGSYYGPSIEPIVALNPDLVLASTGSLDAADSLKNLGYNVLVIEGYTIDDLLGDILLIGRAVDQNTEAAALVSNMRARMDSIAAQLLAATTTPTVYHEVWNEPLMSVGPNTFIDELITLAGGENIFSDATTSWPTVSSEAIIVKNPDVMFFPDMYMGVGNFYETIEAVGSRPGWGSITAVKNDALYEINADIISRSGPRLIDALELIAKMVHPEIFGEL